MDSPCILGTLNPLPLPPLDTQAPPPALPTRPQPFTLSSSTQGTARCSSLAFASSTLHAQTRVPAHPLQTYPPSHCASTKHPSPPPICIHDTPKPPTPSPHPLTFSSSTQGTGRCSSRALASSLNTCFTRPVDCRGDTVGGGGRHMLAECGEVGLSSHTLTMLPWSCLINCCTLHGS
jgi:hypothetical protein